MYNLYNMMTEYMLIKGTTESVFTRAFFCITWNLICYSKNNTTIHLQHLEWSDDCLNIYFANTKNNQLGDRKRKPSVKFYIIATLNMNIQNDRIPKRYARMNYQCPPFLHKYYQLQSMRIIISFVYTYVIKNTDR